MNSYKLGYVCGRIVTRAAIYVTGARTALKSYKFVSRVAKAHKIDSTNPEVVTQNLFKCLKYID